MEAMGCGIPSLVTEVCGMPELVTLENGFIVSHNPSPEEVAETIINYSIKPHDEICKMRKNARNTCEERYHANNNFNDFALRILRIIDNSF